jgi:DNA-binding NtrC family response regulator
MQVPPLRKRRQDVPALAEQLLVQIARELKTAPPTLTPAALEKLSAYAFPGNVRELRNILEHAAILSTTPTIDADELPLPGVAPAPDGRNPLESWIGSLPDSVDLRQVGDDVEKSLIARALAASEGVAAQAARKLGLSRSDLAYKLKRLGIVRGD